MQCGHCRVEYHPETFTKVLGGDAEEDLWEIEYEKCPSCNKFNMRLVWGWPHLPGEQQIYGVKGRRIIHPKGGVLRPKAPPDVPKVIAEDYNEACLVLADSPKASAALSRRCLQTILRDHAKAQAQDLSKQIDEVLATKRLPTHLADDIDAVRQYGNFAATP
ncbi:MAG TPA: DUF4145 domain-containing protein [Terriglobales bacterium]|nr:DUF4145 domain-containing protein [Terriglobales bacterium]